MRKGGHSRLQQWIYIGNTYIHLYNNSKPGASPGQSEVPMCCLLTAGNIKRVGKPEARTDLAQGKNETTSGSN